MVKDDHFLIYEANVVYKKYIMVPTVECIYYLDGV